MNKWMHLLRDIYLIQLLRRDGCADASATVCLGCAINAPQYRCQECTGGLLLCQSCCLEKHVDNPLHVIYVSIGRVFRWNKLIGIFRNGMRCSSRNDL
jgi:hypothetical protein